MAPLNFKHNLQILQAPVEDTETVLTVTDGKVEKTVSTVVDSHGGKDTDRSDAETDAKHDSRTNEDSVTPEKERKGDGFNKDVTPVRT